MYEHVLATVSIAMVMTLVASVAGGPITHLFTIITRTIGAGS